jgi:diguanylate cyclase (GGDEF)-like protein
MQHLHASSAASAATAPPASADGAASGGSAVFDAGGRLTGYTAGWARAQPSELRAAIRPGLQFDELLALELSCGPFRALDGRLRSAWQARRNDNFSSADGRALEFNSRRHGRMVIRCHRLHGGGTLMSLEAAVNSGGDTDLQRRLAHQSTHDELTGLLNRTGLQQAMTALMARPCDTGHLLCYLDLDQFQVINDTCGYEAGDRLLQRVAASVRALAGEHGAVARLGGDEFAVLFPRCSRADSRDAANRLARSVSDDDFVWDGLSFHITATVGAAHSSKVDGDARDLLRAADSACYTAKDGGRDRIKLFSADDSTMNLRHGQMHWVARLNGALQENRFVLHLQPIVPTAGGDGGYLHFEALIRLHQRDGREISPAQFMPAAERYNVISAIDRWVIERSIQVLDDNPLFLDHLSNLALNLSGCSVADAQFLEWCVERLQRHPHVARKLCFEITETAVMAKLSQAQRFIASMREMGCQFALDDFGAGLSSFAYLKELDVDYLKIDGQFVKDLDSDPVHEAMVRAIHQVARVMGKKTVAEYVETDAIRTRLAEIGVDLAQGYGVGKPVPFEEVL